MRPATTCGSRAAAATTWPPGSARRSSSTCGGVAVGDDVLVDNTPYLAFQTYHRHQVPDPEYPAWDQFRRGGRPIYPQRPELLGPRFVRNNGAGLMSGRFGGKMIVVQSLFDEIAYPQQADWYRRAGGASARRPHRRPVPGLVHRPRHAPGSGGDAARSTSSRTALPGSSITGASSSRPCVTWRPGSSGASPRRPAPPTSSTTGRSVCRPPLRPAAASSPSSSCWPTVRVRAEVAVGEPVSFSALVEVPPGTGTIIAAEWDFEGGGDFPVSEPFTNEDLSYESMRITREYAFAAPGTYFPALRVTAHRLGQVDNPHGRVMNLGRVRVVVG